MSIALTVRRREIDGVIRVDIKIKDARLLAS